MTWKFYVLLQAIVTQRWNIYQNKSQHRKLTIEKKSSCHSCPESKLWPSDHEYHTLPLSYPHPERPPMPYWMYNYKCWHSCVVPKPVHKIQNAALRISLYNIQCFFSFLQLQDTTCHAWHHWPWATQLQVPGMVVLGQFPQVPVLQHPGRGSLLHTILGKQAPLAKTECLCHVTFTKQHTVLYHPPTD